VSVPLVRRNLTASLLRTAVAAGGVGVCTLLVLVQLGFYSTCLDVATTIYQPLRYDAVIVSHSYVVTTEAGSISRRRIAQALACPQVESAIPVYIGAGRWRSSVSGNREMAIVVGVDPAQRPFADPELVAQADRLTLDKVLTSRGSQPVLDSVATGHASEIEDHRVEVVGQYEPGPGFLAAGTLVANDRTFHRIFPSRSTDQPTLGLLRARPGADPAAMAAAVRDLLPRDVRVLSTADLEELEQRFWHEHASIEFLFLTGAAVAMITGLVILYQILASDVMSRLPEYATLKAMGYDDRRLLLVVLRQGLALGGLGYAVGLPLALGVYGATRAVAHMPMYLTPARALGVAAGVALIATISALLTARKLGAADPAELF
jgi:putative ABC transport system permease protein